MAWTITFYNERVEKDTQALPKGIKASFIRIAELIKEFGPDLGRPHTVQLENGLYEIRTKGREGIARSLFCTVKDQEIVILLTAIKKAQKLPNRHIDTARKRMKEVHDND